MLRKIKNKKLYEQVVDQITNQIFQGIFQKGEMLPSEAELIKMTGVSRITVREALRVLAEVGIIETRRGKGSFVLVDAEDINGSRVDRNELLEYRNTFMESCKARTIIEPAAAAHMARTATGKQIEALERVIGGADSGQHMGALDQFHLIIMQSLGNTLLMEFFESLLKLEQGSPDIRLIAPEKQARITADLSRQHTKIMEAIRDHNEEFAYFYMKEHCLYLTGVYEEFFNQFYLPIIPDIADIEK